MDYFHLIEPYLYGTLSPEDEIAFEKQLSRNPALAEAASRRLNARQALAEFSKLEPKTEPDIVAQSPSPMRALLFIGIAAILLGLFWLKMRPEKDSAARQEVPVETPALQIEMRPR